MKGFLPANFYKLSGFWIFSSDRTEPPVFEPARVLGHAGDFSKPTPNFKTNSADVFVDLNEDGNADILAAEKNRSGFFSSSLLHQRLVQHFANLFDIEIVSKYK